MREVAFRVVGDPRPQGSKRLLAHGAIVESGGQPLKAWRSDLRDAAFTALADEPRLVGPVDLFVIFLMRRPRSHYSTAKGREDELKASAPAPNEHLQRPDTDKLLRALMDALTSAGVYSDDSHVVHMTVSKVWCDPHELPGAVVKVRALVDDHDYYLHVPTRVVRTAVS